MKRGLMETREVAEALGISKPAVIRLCGRGTLKSFFIGGVRLFDPIEVAKLQCCPEYRKRSRRGTNSKSTNLQVGLFEETGREPGSAEASPTAESDDEPELKAQEF